MKSKKSFKKLPRLIFLWDWCSMCGAHIRCPVCGNDTCNGTFGLLSDGSKCVTCNLAYQYNDLCHLHGCVPQTKGAIIKVNRQLRRAN